MYFPQKYRLSVQDRRPKYLRCFRCFRCFRCYRCCQRFQIFFHLLTIDAAVDIHNKRFICKHSLKYIQKALVPGIVSLLFFKRFSCVFKARPFHKVVNILKMIIEGHPVYAAILGNIVYRYLGKRFFQKKIFKRLLECPFSYLRHFTLRSITFWRIISTVESVRITQFCLIIF